MSILPTLARLLLLLTLALDTSGLLSAMPVQPSMPAEIDADIRTQPVAAPCHETITPAVREPAATTAARTAPPLSGAAHLDPGIHDIGACGGSDCQCGCLVTGSAVAATMSILGTVAPAATLSCLTRSSPPTAAAIPDLRPPIRI